MCSQYICLSRCIVPFKRPIPSFSFRRTVVEVELDKLNEAVISFFCYSYSKWNPNSHKYQYNVVY